MGGHMENVCLNGRSGIIPLKKNGSQGRAKGRTFRATFKTPALRKKKSRRHVKSGDYRNPVVLAGEWQAAIDRGKYASRADLARRKGLSHARVIQVLRLLRLDSDALDNIAAIGDPLTSPVVTERMLRPLVNAEVVVQKRAVKAILKTGEKSSLHGSKKHGRGSLRQLP